MIDIGHDGGGGGGGKVRVTADSVVRSWKATEDSNESLDLSVSVEVDSRPGG